MRGSLQVGGAGERTASLKANVLVKAPDKLYLEVDTLGFPSTILAIAGDALIVYQPYRKQAFVSRGKNTAASVLPAEVPWLLLIQLLLGDRGSVDVASVSSRCDAWTGTLPGGESVEQTSQGLKIRTPEGSWVKWRASKLEKNVPLKDAWFTVRLPEGVRLLDNPAPLR